MNLNSSCSDEGSIPEDINSPLTSPREVVIGLAKTNARMKILKCVDAPQMVQKDTLEGNEIRVVSSFRLQQWLLTDHCFRGTSISEPLGSLKPPRP
jgi:hypothetical protein